MAIVKATNLYGTSVDWKTCQHSHNGVHGFQNPLNHIILVHPHKGTAILSMHVRGEFYRNLVSNNSK